MMLFGGTSENGLALKSLHSLNESSSIVVRRMKDGESA